AKFLHYYFNHRFIKKIKNQYDYFGINYYFHDRIVWYPPFKKNKNEWVNDNGWEIYPEGMYHVLKYAAKFNKPIYILENGISDAKDKDREKFIREHLKYVYKTIQEGVNVRGYFHWSLIDNFEWSYGWALKFGLYEVDRKTFARTPRPSAKFYAEICKNNAIEI
ncbi:glycoside hydrolase family 1 protein, partial [Candidatus Falkowbacteria bacterium]